MSLCIGCMHELNGNVICPDCGFNNSQVQTAPLLPYGTVLDKRYVIGRNVEINGESTRYIAFDRVKSATVFVREFLPAGYFTRDSMKAKLSVNPDKADDYEKLLDSFEKYFSFLATLNDMSAMNEITDIFRANNTCYIVECAEDLISFEEYVARNSGHIDWEIARPLFMPIISLLEVLHKNGYGHYAVSPSNIYITSSGKAMLFGFSTEAQRKRGTKLKSQLFAGCAAPEQYEQNFPIDNITDIYGFTATLFFALTGNLPETAEKRLTDGVLMMNTATVKRLPPHVVSALANGLQVKRENRITDFDDLRSQLSVAPAVKAIQEEISRTASMAAPVKTMKNNHGMSPISVGIIVTAAALLIFLWIGITIVNNLLSEPAADQTQDPTAVSVVIDTHTVQTDVNGNIISTPTTTSVNPGTDGENTVSLANYENHDFEVVKKELVTGYGATVYEQPYENENDGYSDTVPKGYIISQGVAPGTKFDKSGGLIITFKVSKGPRDPELPDIENLTLSSATKQLTALGYMVYAAAPQNSDKVDKDCVIGYRDYSKGDKVSVTQKIYIIVSIGKSESE